MANDAEARSSRVALIVGEALAAAASGSGRLVLLVGEAGIGKTTAARDAVGLARRSGVGVRWAACSADGRTVAYGPWLTLLAGLGPPGQRAIKSLVGAEFGDSASAGAARSTAYAAVVEALEEATVEQPALLVLDDLHWADEGTLLLLDAVAGHLPGIPVLVIGSYRDTDIVPGSPLTRLGGRADRLTIRGLDQRSISALLGHQIGRTHAETASAEVFRLTAGNPFLVVQLGRLLAEEPRIDLATAFEPGTRDLLAQRLGALDDESRDLLCAAGILGSSFRFVDLCEMHGGKRTAVTEALDRATALRIIERAPGTGTWAFVHDLFRRAALEGRSTHEIIRLHRRAASVLELVDEEPAVIAAHLLACCEVPDSAAAAWCVRAGDRALHAMAWEEASGHYERALAALGNADHDQVRAAALAGSGRARLLSGDGAGASAAFDDLATLARSANSPELLARAALGLSADLSGFEVRLFDQHQIDLLEEAARRLSGGADHALEAMVLGRLSVALSLVAPDDRRRHLAEAAVRLARRSGDPIVIARALAVHCDVISGPAHVPERVRQATEIIDIAERVADGPLELLGRRLRYVARLESGDLAGTEEDTNAFARRAVALGNPLYSWYVPLWQAQLALVAGDVDAADRLIAEVGRLGRAGGSTNAPMLATVARLGIAWQRGDYDGALRLVESLGETAPELVDYISSIGAYAWAFCLADRRVEAIALLDRAVALGIDDQYEDAEWLPNMVNLVRAAALLEHALLPRALDLLEPYAELFAFEGIGAVLYGSVARIVALGCRTLGRHDDAVRYAERALAANRPLGGTLLADALRTLAECLGASGQNPVACERIHAEADAAYLAARSPHLVRCSSSESSTTDDPVGNALIRDGDVWHVTFSGRRTIIKHSKGLADLAVLLARPNQEVHITELEGVAVSLMSGHGGQTLDHTAIGAYRARLRDLTEEIDEAELFHDNARAERSRAEYDSLSRSSLLRSVSVVDPDRPGPNRWNGCGRQFRPGCGTPFADWTPFIRCSAVTWQTRCTPASTADTHPRHRRGGAASREPAGLRAPNEDRLRDPPGVTGRRRPTPFGIRPPYCEQSPAQGWRRSRVR